MRSTAILLLALTACTSGTDPDTDDTVEDSGSEDTGTEDSGEHECSFPTEDTSGADGVQLSGVIRDASGNPLADAEIGLCKQICRSLCTDENGGFSYTYVPDDTYSFHVRPPHGEELTEIVWPLTFAGTAVVQDVSLPVLPTMTDLPGTAAEVEVATGLHITVGQGDLKIIFEADPTEIGAVAIDTPQFPVPSGAFVAGWFVEPYNAKSEAGLPVRFATPSTVTAGSTLRAYMSSYDDFQWVDLGTFTESGGYLTADDANAGALPVLATLILVDES